MPLMCCSVRCVDMLFPVTSEALRAGFAPAVLERTAVGT